MKKHTPYKFLKSLAFLFIWLTAYSPAFAVGPDSLRAEVLKAFAPKTPSLNLSQKFEKIKPVRPASKEVLRSFILRVCAVDSVASADSALLKDFKPSTPAVSFSVDGLSETYKDRTTLDGKGMKPSEKAAKKRWMLRRGQFMQAAGMQWVLNVPRVAVRRHTPQKDLSQPKPAVDEEPEEIKAKKDGALACAPVDEDRERTYYAADYFFAYKQTVSDGAWNVGSTWSGGSVPLSTDSVQINHHVTMPSGTTTNSGIYIAETGWLEYSPGTSSQLDISRNFIIEGLLTMEPNAHSVIHRIRFININEDLFEGGGMDVKVNDIGIWVMKGGRVSLRGSSKTPWTNVVGSVAAGATSMTLVDVTGWQVGDEFVLAPTEEGDASGLDWDEFNQKGIDPFLSKFERRTITSIVGNVVSWTTPLVYNHNQVVSNVPSSTYGADNQTWTAEVANMTRNVRIGGSSWTSKSHMFIRNDEPAVQNILYVEFSYTGPTKINNAVSTSRETLVSGRYTVHIHFADYFSQGSLIYGCSSSYSGNRVYVPHESHRIRMDWNVAFDSQEAMFWWDQGETSHFITWEHNLMLGMRFNGGFDIQFSMMISQGDGNAARHNVAVYASNWNLHGTGAYIWQANNEGVWIFEFNMAHSCAGAGLWVWQNTSLNHTIVFYDSYHNAEGITHGAYSNSYEYTGGHHYRSMIFIEASSANSNGVVFKDIYVDAGGEDYGVHIQESPAAGTASTTNKLIQCVIKGYAVAGVYFLGGGVGGFAQPKMVDLVNNDIGDNDGDEYLWDDVYGFNNGSWIRLQKIGSGTNRKREQVSGSPVNTSGFADFYPNTIGDGLLGLKGKYYNENGFADYKFTRREAIVYFDVWRPDGAILPRGVHHLVTWAVETPVNSNNWVQTDATYSIQYIGRVQTYESGNYNFKNTGSGKLRMYLDDGGGEDLIIDQWSSTSTDVSASSSPISLSANTKYAVRVEFQNNAPVNTGQGFSIEWKSPSMAAYELIPQSQLFGPVTNDAPIGNAGADQSLVTTATATTLNASMSTDEDGRIESWSWSKVSGPGSQTFGKSTAVGTGVYGLEPGTYQFRLTVTDNEGSTDTDDVQVVVAGGGGGGNVGPTADAGGDISITLPVSMVTVDGIDSDDPDGSLVSYLWEKISGPSSYTITNAAAQSTTITGLVEGVYQFRLTVTDNGTPGLTDSDVMQVTVNALSTTPRKYLLLKKKGNN